MSLFRFCLYSAVLSLLGGFYFAGWMPAPGPGVTPCL